MKSLLRLLLVLFLISRYGYAQVPHTLTIADLQQLADCPDQYCLGSRVNQENYTYKGPQKGKNNGLEGTQYRYIRPHSNPMFTEFAASYWVMKDNSRRVSFTSDNKVWIAGLKSAVERSGFTFVRQKGMFGDKEFVRNEGGRTWHLNWAEPRLLVDAEPHTLTVYGEGKPALPVAAATPTPVDPVERGDVFSNELPHLGGDWDAKYPVSDAAQLFKAERQYAADYERGHGKTGNTFSRCEKVRIQGRYRSQYRLLTTEHWDKSFDNALRHTGFDAFADNRAKLYKQEVLVDVAGEPVWMPIQEIVIKTLETEAKAGETITFYAVLVSHHDFSGTLHLSFLINEFAAARTTDSFDPKPGTTQPTAELVLLPRPTKPVATVSQKATIGRGFNWVPWNKVTVAEKSEMRKVLVMGDDGPNMGLLRFIAGEISQGNRIQIAQHDFYQDGQPGYVVYVEYKTPQYGYKGRVEVFENLREYKLFPPAHVKANLCAVRPFDNGDTQRRSRGVLGDDGQLTEFSGGAFFERAYARFLRETRPTPPGHHAQ